MFPSKSSVLGTVLWLALTPAAWAWELPELMSLLAQNRSGEARFTEQRWVSELGQPLQSSGTLSFVAPDRFTRTTLSPTQESMSVQGNTVVLKRGNRSRTLSLDATPEVAAIVEAVRGTLMGQGDVLRQHFTPRLSGAAAQWTLELVPLEARLAGQVSQVSISGVRQELHTVEIKLADGDRSLMRIEPLKTAP